MDDKAWQLLIKDIDEMKSDIKEVKESVSGLKMKMATFSTMFGLIGAYIKSKFFH